MYNDYFNAKDAPLAKYGEGYITIDGNRYAAFFAKSVKVTANVKTKEVPMLNRVITPRRATGMEVKIDMTIYKCTEIFDKAAEQFKKTGVLPEFEIVIGSEDPATSIGRSSKVYKNCVIDGDLLLSMLDSGEDNIEQQVTAYAQDYESISEYTAPDYLKQ
ncbi:MAG: hypothetical protein IJ766_09190 [Clostridia bacterium]|nr:hypothetical protein [Clostridia bacterium]